MPRIFNLHRDPPGLLPMKAHRRKGQIHALALRRQTALALETQLAKVLGGQRQPGSGSLGHPGDVQTDEFLVEAKDTDLQQLPQTVSILEKIAREARSLGRQPALATRFKRIAEPEEQIWVTVPLSVFVTMLDALRAWSSNESGTSHNPRHCVRSL